ncbi:hypothetical protein [Streptomyces gibsoniae]|uniref:Lipoprotein n=1 Tax=Streptomyces gibsoniae TaxID=3075529 RepID=A0ABU2U4P6_9ACTN|nr:hypothetical protein [Streptomyces sp. DSM 41699]MDT0468198.1 hypothetical protein [Streptomyces sp. DSM 41699]
MQRTTTSATLLVAMAVSALSGCVTVQRPSAPLPPRAPSQSSAPRAEGSVAPHVVQAPAREALERAGTSRSPSAGADTGHMAGTAPSTARTDAPHQRSVSPHPGREHPGHRAEAPSAAPAPFPGNADVCALGRSYGGWRPGSPEADICRSTYGR